MTTIINNSTLGDTCRFPSFLFGRSIQGRLASDVITGSLPASNVAPITVTHPDDENLTIVDGGTGQSITNEVDSAIDSNISISVTGKVITQSAPPAADSIATTASGVTVTSSFGGIASDVNVTITARGATIVGKQCD